VTALATHESSPGPRPFQDQTKDQTRARVALSHRLVHHALEAVAAGIRNTGIAAGDNRGNLSGYAPLVIVGPAGSGKSRLLAEWFVQHSLTAAGRPTSSAAIMWDGRSLGRDLTTALSQNAIDRLHMRFVASRLIMIDGVEQITAWDAQRALAHLFDAASVAGTAFVATLRIHPIACTLLEPSLASRLSGGLVVSMPPVGTTRYEGTGDAFTGRREVSLRRVINAAARHHGLTAADLVGSSRCRQVSQARGLAMYLARRLTTQSLQSIGDAFGGRDHTTVMHGIRGTELRRSLDAGLAAEIDRLMAALVGR
jgi:chromosomal replication initiation ATPase DnaA